MPFGFDEKGRPAERPPKLQMQGLRPRVPKLPPGQREGGGKAFFRVFGKEADGFGTVGKDRNPRQDGTEETGRGVLVQKRGGILLNPGLSGFRNSVLILDATFFGKK